MKSTRSVRKRRQRFGQMTALQVALGKLQGKDKLVAGR
jgi:hypothetical protein